MFDISVRDEGGTTVLGLSGKLTGVLGEEQREQVLGVVRPGARIVLDLTRLEEVSGTGIRNILLYARHVRAQGGEITARGASERLREVAMASGFLDLFARGAPGTLAVPRRTAALRMDYYPTHTHGEYALRAGAPMPLGATSVAQGVNFAAYSRHATACTLVLFDPGAREPKAEIPLPPEFRVGDVFAMTVFDLDSESIEYGFRMDGPFEPREGHRFDRTKVLLDPAARAIAGRATWGEGRGAPLRSMMIREDFDWEGDRPLGRPIEELVVYEMHVRGFTRDASSGVRFPGTYAGLRERIGHLVELGVNCVELLPVFEFDELEVGRVNPRTGKPLCNYWGYSTIGFYAPKAAYAATGAAGLQADEFKTLVKELHRSGIEVILDVVFNHTSEGDERGPTLCFRGLDNRIYYMLTPDGHYYNFSGCGNTLNCNHPAVRDFVLNCLRYWVAEYHIDGFRFDLASILGRDARGVPLGNPPLLEALAQDPVLGRTKLIAEAWDAGGLYQVGHFPAYGRWAEWNGKYRDCVRKFLKGDMGQVAEMSQRLAGSPDLYYGRGPAASVNFLTCHDGFSLADLVSYNDKHNEANGEDNRDGANDNNSWNCGVEGPTDQADILALRRRQVKNAVAVLLVSQGIPMLLMGDEMGHTQEGNNNTYCQDNPLTWLDWRNKEKNAELFRFCRNMIAIRKGHPALRHIRYAVPGSPGPGGHFELTWHGLQVGRPDWQGTSRTLAFTARLRDGGVDDHVYVALNMYWEPLPFELPPADGGRAWHVLADTDRAAPGDAAEPGHGQRLENQKEVSVAGRSVVVLAAR